MLLHSQHQLWLQTHIFGGQELHPSGHLIGEAKKIHCGQTLRVIREKLFYLTFCWTHTHTHKVKHCSFPTTSLNVCACVDALVSCT